MKIHAIAFAFGVFLSSVAEAQTRCPSFAAVSASDRAGSELRNAARSAHRQAGRMVGDDLSFDLVHAALREAELHSHYLISLYMILSDLAESSAKEFLTVVFIPGIGTDIVRALSLVDSFIPSVRDAAVRGLLERSVELRRSLGRDFELCRLS